LGRKADFIPESGKVVPLWQESENLVFQAEKLALGRYFIGVDSSFCHIAGMLGVPGNVLFFNTKASDVIDRYPSLSGIDCFDGKEPSRSLRPDCKLSNLFKDGLSVQAVVDAVAAGLSTTIS